MGRPLAGRTTEGVGGSHPRGRRRQARPRRTRGAPHAVACPRHRVTPQCMWVRGFRLSCFSSALWDDPCDELEASGGRPRAGASTEETAGSWVLGPVLPGPVAGAVCSPPAARAQRHPPCWLTCTHVPLRTRLRRHHVWADTRPGSAPGPAAPTAPGPRAALGWSPGDHGTQPAPPPRQHLCGLFLTLVLSQLSLKQMSWCSL